jgi:hypothetical protein
MKPSIFSLLLIIALLTLPGTGIRPAMATVNNVTSNCSSVTVTGTSAPSTPVFVEVRLNVNPFPVLGTQNLDSNGAGNYTSVVGIPTQTVGTSLRINVTDSTGFSQRFVNCTPGVRLLHPAQALSYPTTLGMGALIQNPVSDWRSGAIRVAIPPACSFMA